MPTGCGPSPLQSCCRPLPRFDSFHSQVVWQGYISTMRSVGFNASTRVYVASGMLTYGASGGCGWVGVVVWCVGG
jgi:hypothetical protein